QSIDSIQISSNLQCPSDSSPSSLLGLFQIFSVVLLLERSYASNQYAHYERTTRLAHFHRITIAMWCLFIVYIFSRSSSSIFSIFLPLQCSPPRLNFPPVDEFNLPILIFFVFFVVFTIVFYIHHDKNKSTLLDYVRKDYSSLSSRYQLKENTTTCRRFLIQNGALSLLCLFTLLYYNGMAKDGTTHKEVQFFFYPLAGIIISLNFLIFHESVNRKLIAMYWNTRDHAHYYWIASFHSKIESSEALLP
ncbi:hypothetical protein PFISCL1PPCAC_14654, partial [Pristionchus fissidentatus]